MFRDLDDSMYCYQNEEIEAQSITAAGRSASVTAAKIANLAADESLLSTLSNEHVRCVRNDRLKGQGASTDSFIDVVGETILGISISLE